MQRHLYTARSVHEFVKNFTVLPGVVPEESLKKWGGGCVLEGAGHAALPGGECGVLDCIEKEGKAPRWEKKGQG